MLFNAFVLPCKILLTFFCFNFMKIFPIKFVWWLISFRRKYALSSRPGHIFSLHPMLPPSSWQVKNWSLKYFPLQKNWEVAYAQQKNSLQKFYETWLKMRDIAKLNSRDQSVEVFYWFFTINFLLWHLKDFYALFVLVLLLCEVFAAAQLADSLSMNFLGKPSSLAKCDLFHGKVCERWVRRWYINWSDLVNFKLDLLSKYSELNKQTKTGSHLGDLLSKCRCCSYQKYNIILEEDLSLALSRKFIWTVV